MASSQRKKNASVKKGRGELKLVYRDTVQNFATGKYKKVSVGPYERITFDEILKEEREWWKANQKDLKGANAGEKGVCCCSEAKVKVQDEDTLLVTQELLKIGYKKNLVLNMASDYRPGGGVESGSSAQEEELFRRTGYHKAIEKSFYPLYDGVVVSQKVPIVKDEHYKYLPRPLYADFIACPGIRRPCLNDSGTDYEDKKEDESMVQRVRAVFAVGRQRGYETLVLGALGCGAFANPVKRVLAIFHKMVSTYRPFFKEIRFAVLDKGTGNYAKFKGLEEAFPPCSCHIGTLPAL